LGEAERAYQLAIDTGHADQAPQAAVNLGVLCHGRQDFAAAELAFQLAIDSGHADMAPKATFDLGVLREDQGDLGGAERAYQLAIDSGHPSAASCAREAMTQLRTRAAQTHRSARRN
jgi:tetratricopeptide (TPR) repeat protein